MFGYQVAVTKPNFLSAHFESRDNSLNAVRLFLALAVAIAHALTIKNGLGSIERIRIFDLTTSYMAVNGFFMLSGMLIAWSLSFRKDLVFFITARVLRLLPALIVLALISALVVGPIFTAYTFEQYVRDPDFWQYPLRVITFGRVDDGPPGLFSTAPWPGEFSGSLWTLRYEALAYVGAAIVFATGLLRTRVGPALLAVLSIAAFSFLRMKYADTLNDTPIFSVIRFAVCFTLGMTAYAYGKWIPVRWRYLPLLLGLFFLFGKTSVAEIIGNLALGYLILLVGFRAGTVFDPIQKMPDMSYGIYIWHWPIYQIFLLKNSDVSAWVLVFVAIPLAMLVALLSWVYIEKPSLGLKVGISSWVHQFMFRLKRG
ncbi:MAG: acyltransferase [Robiginitomaculum sp.]|nr:MAG: acyltransferase [Robiginitomaculum sp.]